MTENQQTQVYECLDSLIRREECVLTYDRTLLDQLPEIIREVHGIHSREQVAGNKHLARMFRLLDPQGQAERDVRRLPQMLREANIDEQRYSTCKEVARSDEENFQEYSRSSGGDDQDAVVQLQHDLGKGLYGGDQGGYDSHLLPHSQLRKYLRYVSAVRPTFWEKLYRSSFWGMQIEKWKRRGLLKTDRPSLSIGPRWLTEIHYFREIHGLQQHIGLDLHSEDEELVKVGDMHNMPFEDRQFGFLFIKNTADKSYDIRKLVREMLRVVMPGGIIAIDQNCFHGAATILHRTDIQRAENFLKLFEAQTRLKVLVCQTVDISGVGDAAENNEKRNNARLAIQIYED